MLALTAVYLGLFRDYRPFLAPGEKATIAIIAANRSQARSTFRFVIGLLEAVPLIKPMIVDYNTETIELDMRNVGNYTIHFAGTMEKMMRVCWFGSSPRPAVGDRRGVRIRSRGGAHRMGF